MNDPNITLCLCAVRIYFCCCCYFYVILRLISLTTNSFQMAKRVNVSAHPSQLELGQVDSQILLELFPFAVILDRDMRITRAGEKILETWILQNPSRPPQSFWGSRLVDIFKLRRPKGLRVEWNTVLQMNLVIFELELMRSESDSDDAEHVAKAVIDNGIDYPVASTSDAIQAVEAAQNGTSPKCFDYIFLGHI